VVRFLIFFLDFRLLLVHMFDRVSSMDRRVAELIEAVDAIDPIADGDLIVGLALLADRIEAKLTGSLVRFVGEGRHERDGWRSPGSWLRAHTPLTDRRAVALATTAKRLQSWPTVTAAFDDGSVNAAQVETIVRGVAKDHVELFADHDADITPLLVGLSVRDTRAAVREWDTLADAVCSPDPATIGDGSGTPDPEADQGGATAVDGESTRSDGLDGVEVDARLHLSRTFRDRGILDGDLDPDTVALLEKALALFEPADVPGGPVRTAARRRAIALRRLSRFALDQYPSRGRRPARQHPHLTAIIDLGDLCAGSLRGHGIRTPDDLERFLGSRSVSVVEEGFMRHALAHRAGTAHTYDGHLLTPAALATLFGPGTLVARVLMADGRVLDHGTDVRFAQGAMRDAMVVRDMGCRFPGCDARVAHLDGHHITRFGPDGPTALTNLVALCSGHHGIVHRDGWTTTAHDDGTVTFHRPDGTTLTSPPPRAERPPALPLRPRGSTAPTLDRAPLAPSSNRGGRGAPTGAGHERTTHSAADPESGARPPGSHGASVDATGHPDPVPRRAAAIAIDLRDLVITGVDADGYPTTATHGDAEIHLRWDHTPAHQRAAEVARIRDRVRSLRPIPPTDPLAAWRPSRHPRELAAPPRPCLTSNGSARHAPRSTPDRRPIPLGPRPGPLLEVGLGCDRCDLATLARWRTRRCGTTGRRAARRGCATSASSTRSSLRSPPPWSTPPIWRRRSGCSTSGAVPARCSKRQRRSGPTPSGSTSPRRWSRPPGDERPVPPPSSPTRRPPISWRSPLDRPSTGSYPGSA
jgi:hypothetical protein